MGFDAFLSRLVGDPLSIATLLVACGTIALVWTTFLQVRAIKKNMTLTQRAFVYVKQVMAHPLRGGDGKIRSFLVEVILENSGETPTKHMLSYVSGQSFDSDGIPDGFNFPDIGEESSVHGLLGPKSMVAVGRFEISVDNARQLVMGSSDRLFLWGWCEYDDIFAPATKRHRTEFCYELSFMGDTFPEGISIGWKYYRVHNGADDECMKPIRPYVAVRT